MEASAPGEAAVIAAVGLQKRFGAVQAVKSVDLTVEKGRCIGLLGPNGAGKTTTMRMIMGLTRPSGGALTLFGKTIGEAGRAERARIGLVPQEDNLDPDLTVRQNLEVYARYFAVDAAVAGPRIDELLGFMALREKAEQTVMALSGGMKRRLVIARALVAEPDLVILDEPTTGLDPQARVMIWRQLLRLKGQGKTLLLTTHYMDEAQRLCDRIVIVDGGVVLDEGSPEALIKRRVRGHVVEVKKPLPAGVSPPADAEVEDIGDSLLLYVDDPASAFEALGAEAEFLHRPANLEDVFLRLTGRQLREGG